MSLLSLRRLMEGAADTGLSERRVRALFASKSLSILSFRRLIYRLYSTVVLFRHPRCPVELICFIGGSDCQAVIVVWSDFLEYPCFWSRSPAAPAVEVDKRMIAAELLLAMPALPALCRQGRCPREQTIIGLGYF